MRAFPSREAFREITGAAKKWQLTLEAVALAPRLIEGVMYSIGDSLTYRQGPTRDFASAVLLGRRRYQMVVAAIKGDVRVEIAPQAHLTSVAAYDDLTDREAFVGAATTVVVPCGGFLIVDIDEAARVLPHPDTACVVLHVTVEGATFHNK